MASLAIQISFDQSIFPVSRALQSRPGSICPVCQRPRYKSLHHPRGAGQWTVQAQARWQGGWEDLLRREVEHKTSSLGDGFLTARAQYAAHYDSLSSQLFSIIRFAAFVGTIKTNLDEREVRGKVSAHAGHSPASGSILEGGRKAAERLSTQLNLGKSANQ